MPQPPIRVILVEDDRDLRQGLADFLRLSGIAVKDVPSGVAFYQALRVERFDIAILDVNLPDTSGFDLAGDLAREGRMGVIMLTARTGRADRLRGYAEGADLYLAKPVDGEELVLAVRNLARRTRRDAAEQAGENWRLSGGRRLLIAPGGAELQLSGREFLLLELFAAAGGATVPRAALIEGLGYAGLGAESRSLDAVLRRLRHKAHRAGAELPVIAVHAVGLRFCAPLLPE